jgi:2-amino-4-hydroxy-6-hydroxymethyldihydropteridine diphosphokinase
VIAYLGLGSNLGDRLENLSRAVELLDDAEGIEVRERSVVYETEPAGDPKQPRYLNAVVRVETVLSAKSLLDVCLAVEKSMGRVRAKRWDSRNIDVDLLIYGDEVISTEKLIVPHPLMHEREFVLRPLADIAPDIVHPVLLETVRDMLAAVEGSSGARRMDGFDLTRYCSGG